MQLELNVRAAQVEAQAAARATSSDSVAEGRAEAKLAEVEARMLEVATQVSAAKQAETRAAAADQQIGELKATIRAFESRLAQLDAEHRKLEEAAAASTTTVSNSLDGHGQTRNVANSRLGAAVWFERTTPVASGGVWAPLAAAAQKLSTRYEGAGIALRQSKMNRPETVLDEAPVRGYRDGFCTLEPLALGVHLAYPQKIKALQFEHVTGHDHAPEAAPKVVHVQAYTDVISEDSPVHATSYTNIQFDTHGVARFTERLPEEKITR
ncbi:hypothetical protein GNI_165520 [Gregarina niphandrodes]|uniref:Uncharacterized protein n=1 Tax=Gregarina niphandrodes TaxID=110365 RepID=A0A023AY47_GRENI|nr:hypothetical protein GNI_165520 [Gregarina niphandrodes]EZG43577.1 hypothetical protein GNI_165520 [Gregarina niphandrodes]|eukprot:XP_011133185.1 hypothetical protein GNI_165520 [Gregarina niphandrodes]